MALILVVEQEGRYIERIRDALTSEGWQVRVAKEADEALKAADQEPPQLVLVNRQTEGAERLLQIFARKTGGPGVVAVLPESAVNLQEPAADDSLAKPFTESDLRLAVRRGLAPHPEAPAPPAAEPGDADRQLTAEDIFGDLVAEMEGEIEGSSRAPSPSSPSPSSPSPSSPSPSAPSPSAPSPSPGPTSAPDSPAQESPPEAAPPEESKPAAEAPPAPPRTSPAQPSPPPRPHRVRGELDLDKTLSGLRRDLERDSASEPQTPATAGKKPDKPKRRRSKGKGDLDVDALLSETLSGFDLGSVGSGKKKKKKGKETPVSPTPESGEEVGAGQVEELAGDQEEISFADLYTESLQEVPEPPVLEEVKFEEAPASTEPSAEPSPRESGAASGSVPAADVSSADVSSGDESSGDESSAELSRPETPRPETGDPSAPQRGGSLADWLESADDSMFDPAAEEAAEGAAATRPPAESAVAGGDSGSGLEAGDLKASGEAAAARPATSGGTGVEPPATASTAAPDAAPAAPAAAEADKAGTTEEEGRRFGQYTLLERIAVGGMAEVWKARMSGVEGFQKTVAIKKILPHLTDNDDFVNMFIDEAKLAAQLSHPNIIHIYDLGKIGGHFYIAMEYVEGENLRNVLNDSRKKTLPLPRELALLTAARLASALDYAHRKKDFEDRELGLVHRDVSPQNVLISSEGDIKLCDFGIVKAVSKASQTQMGALKGKLQYMSPEQAWGKEVDARSDIFSLGAILFEMLTGRRLFAGDSEISVLEAVRRCEVVAPRDLDPEIPEKVEAIVLRALEQDPERRFQTAGEMQQELEALLYSIKPTPGHADLAEYLERLIATPESDAAALDAAEPDATASDAAPVAASAESPGESRASGTSPPKEGTERPIERPGEEEPEDDAAELLSSLPAFEGEAESATGTGTGTGAPSPADAPAAEVEAAGVEEPAAEAPGPAAERGEGLEAAAFAPASDEVEIEEGGSRGKLWLLLVIVIVVLAGAAASYVYWRYYRQPTSPETDTPIEETAPATGTPEAIDAPEAETGTAEDEEAAGDRVLPEDASDAAPSTATPAERSPTTASARGDPAPSRRTPPPVEGSRPESRATETRAAESRVPESRGTESRPSASRPAALADRPQPEPAPPTPAPTRQPATPPSTSPQPAAPAGTAAGTATSTTAPSTAPGTPATAPTPASSEPAAEATSGPPSEPLPSGDPLAALRAAEEAPEAGEGPGAPETSPETSAVGAEEPEPVDTLEVAPPGPEPAPESERDAEPPPQPPQDPEVREGDLVGPGPGVTSPVLVSFDKPSYPPIARRMKIEGDVVLSLLVDETGRVLEARLIRGVGGKGGGLHEAALKAARRARYRPATKNGVRVKMWTTLKIPFRL